jgi:hypothetical protein
MAAYVTDTGSPSRRTSLGRAEMVNVVGEVCSIFPSNPASLNISVVIGGGGPPLTLPPPHPARLMAAHAMAIAKASLRIPIGWCGYAARYESTHCTHCEHR